MTEPIVRAGQVWANAENMREVTILRTDTRHAYGISDTGRRTRILLRRMKPSKNGYYLKMESPARYVSVPSTRTCACGGAREYHVSTGCLHCGHKCKEFVGRPYQVWAGDMLSPAHCPCEDFRWAPRKAGEPYLCKHLKFLLKGEPMV